MNSMFYHLLQIPVPKDIPLALPLPYWLLVAILVFSFLLHILFVNLMIGGTLFTLWAQMLGRKNKHYNQVAKEIENTITVNKSLAVVMGVAPLLSINVLYTVYFYTSSILIGYMWISVIPLVIVAFLLGYLHKYTWEKMANNQLLHISIIAGAALIFLFIPFIFLANINLLQFPEKWGEVQGLFSAVSLNNVIPRYLHFITATIAVTGIFFYWFFGRKKYPFEERIQGVGREEIKRKALSIGLAATAAQFVFGPLLFLTLPAKGIEWNLFLYIGLGVTAAIFAIAWMWRMVNSPVQKPVNRFVPVIVALTITVIFMGTGRQFYRSNALAPHQKLVDQKTEQYLQLAEEARQLHAEGKLEEAAQTASMGQQLFDRNCAACHQQDSRLIGPPIKEIVPMYEGKKEELIAWIREPGRKRESYPPMPGFPQLSEEKLDRIAEYMLGLM